MHRAHRQLRGDLRPTAYKMPTNSSRLSCSPLRLYRTLHCSLPSSTERGLKVRHKRRHGRAPPRRHHCRCRPVKLLPLYLLQHMPRIIIHTSPQPMWSFSRRSSPHHAWSSSPPADAASPAAPPCPEHLQSIPRIGSFAPAISSSSNSQLKPSTTRALSPRRLSRAARDHRHQAATCVLAPLRQHQ